MIAGPGGSRRTLQETEGRISHLWTSPDRTRILYTGADGSHVLDVATGEDSRVTTDGNARVVWADNDTLFVEPFFVEVP